MFQRTQFDQSLRFDDPSLRQLDAVSDCISLQPLRRLP